MSASHNQFTHYYTFFFHQVRSVSKYMHILTPNKNLINHILCMEIYMRLVYTQKYCMCTHRDPRVLI